VKIDIELTLDAVFYSKLTRNWH